PCTKDSCTPATGCSSTPLTGTSCSDSNACTTNDKCADGKCTGAALTCSDSNSCTTDLCDPAKGCIFPPVPDSPAQSCEDGNKCTVGDVCSAGVCKAGPPPNCDDDNVCTTDVCNLSNGQCGHTNNQVACNDNNVCTQTDKCSGGTCVGSNPVSCNDNNPCTNDSCDPGKGCVSVDNGTCECNFAAECKDDGNLCNGVPVCTNGKCVVDPASVPPPCSTTGDTACLKNKCVPATGLCVKTPEPKGTSCSDGSACTEKDQCDGTGKCAGTVIVCEDNNPCTDNKCLAASGCSFPNKTGSCSDGNVCTVDDSCTNGACVGKPYDCNDSNLCTQDVCVPGTDGMPSCSHPSASGPCDDSNQCTVGDACVNGTCTGSPLVCSDGNACTDDSCNTATGCVFSPSPDGTACSDGNLCTTPDVCKSGVCKAGPWAIACCLQPKDCDDNYPCTTETCSANQCIYTLKSCGQANGCLAGYCDPAGSCKSAPAQSSVTLYEQSFEAGSPGWLFGINGGGSPDIYWSVSNKRSADGKYSLYAGNPTDYSYDHGVGNAVALSPQIALPAGMEATLKLAYYSLVQESGCNFDNLVLRVHDAGGAVTDLSPKLCDATSGFVNTTYSLKGFAGKTVRIALVFETP
ncbi:MAG: hypothetical protein FJ109_21450, partial [Deltaproteobacteria bacterium]|nr:hypothetical protein [Deltaproteobacteria bacterium]